jgi:hypothetical protein
MVIELLSIAAIVLEPVSPAFAPSDRVQLELCWHECLGIASQERFITVFSRLGRFSDGILNSPQCTRFLANRQSNLQTLHSQFSPVYAVEALW